jgi:hypothetical protein
VLFGVGLTPYLKQLKVNVCVKITVNYVFWIDIIVFWHSKDFGELCKALTTKLHEAVQIKQRYGPTVHCIHLDNVVAHFR